MPVLARSPSSISAMTCLPDRLMRRRSSTSLSKPSRTKPPSRASAGGSSAIAWSIHCAEIRQVVELAGQAAEQRRLAIAQQQREPGRRRQRARQRHQVARSRRRQRDPGDQSLEILDRLQRLARLAALGRLDRELFDGVEAIADRLERGQRAKQPRAEQPAPHRRDRAIDLVEQRSARGRRPSPARSRDA